MHPLHAAQVLVRVVDFCQSSDGQREAGSHSEERANSTECGGGGKSPVGYLYGAVFRYGAKNASHNFVGGGGRGGAAAVVV